MQIHNPNTHMLLSKELSDFLAKLRSERNFSAQIYINKKTAAINKYMRKHSLNSCVVGISGGIDSAVTLGIIFNASLLKDSPIKKIVPVLMPIFSKEGATNQKQSIYLGKIVTNKFKLKPFVLDLTRIHEISKKTVDKNIKIDGKGWASGQLVTYIRTPVLYYITSLLSQAGYHSIVCGTTNRDEGAYLGFFGKASDGMVDLQIISDIHKSEVYDLARLMGIPKEVIESIPSGDTYNGRTDEEFFGTTYDFVELYILYLTLLTKSKQEKIQQKWSIKTKKQFKILVDRLEKIHNYNNHKYLGSPSVHLDIYDRKISGGWTK